jgi:hypothetical protein
MTHGQKSIKIVYRCFRGTCCLHQQPTQTVMLYWVHNIYCTCMVTEQSQSNRVAWRRRPFMVFLTHFRQIPGIPELWTPLSISFPSHQLESSPLKAVYNLCSWYKVIKRTNKQHHFHFSFWTSNMVFNSILVNDQFDALFFNVFISCLYMFRETSAHHQEGQLLVIHHLV